MLPCIFSQKESLEDRFILVILNSQRLSEVREDEERKEEEIKIQGVWINTVNMMNLLPMCYEFGDCFIWFQLLFQKVKQLSFC